jgi:hypothetical protein
MKKFFSFLCIVVLIILTGCSLSQSGQTIPSEQSGMYKTYLSQNNKLSIVRQPPEADFSFIHPGVMKELPNYDPNSSQMWQVDLRSSNATALHLDDSLKDLLHADFDSKTKWPDKLP